MTSDVATPAPKGRFRLLQGLHYEPNPNYRGNNRHHPERLVCYGQNTPAGTIVESERDLAQTFPNKFERVVEAGSPVTEVRRQLVAALITANQAPEEDRAFLEALSDDGFARVQRLAARAEEKPARPGPLGDEVTDNFQLAYDAGFQVWRNPAGKHQVTRRGQNRKPLNLAPLEAAEVEAFVEKFQKESRK